MQKSIILACCSLAVLPAFAQSNVTLYGFMDAGVAHVSNNNGTSSNNFRSGNFDYSHFGLRGSEDLGSGLNAVFNLEAAVNLGNGDYYSAAFPFFSRQAWVGLKSSGLGQLTLGRQFPLSSDIFVPTANAYYLGSQTAALDGTAAGPVKASANRFDNMIGGIRLNNSVKFRSDSFNGFQLHAMAVIKEQDAKPAAGAVGRTAALGMSYSNDIIDAGALVQTVDCLPSVCAPGNDAKDKLYGVSAAYKSGGSRFGFIYTKQKNAKNVQGNNADVLSLLATVPYNQWRFSAGYQFLNDKTRLNQDVRQFNLGVNYGLSKRTFLYALYSRQTVKNGGIAGMAFIDSSNSRQNQFTTGIAHSF